MMGISVSINTLLPASYLVQCFHCLHRVHSFHFFKHTRDTIEPRRDHGSDNELAKVALIDGSASYGVSFITSLPHLLGLELAVLPFVFRNNTVILYLPFATKPSLLLFGFLVACCVSRTHRHCDDGPEICVSCQRLQRSQRRSRIGRHRLKSLDNFRFIFAIRSRFVLAITTIRQAIC